MANNVFDPQIYPGWIDSHQKHVAVIPNSITPPSCHENLIICRWKISPDIDFSDCYLHSFFSCLALSFVFSFFVSCMNGQWVCSFRWRGSRQSTSHWQNKIIDLFFRANRNKVNGFIIWTYYWYTGLGWAIHQIFMISCNILNIVIIKMHFFFILLLSFLKTLN